LPSAGLHYCSLVPTITPEIQSVLRDSERLLWSGRPDPRVLFTRADVILIPFSALFLGFALFWEFTALTTPTRVPFAPVFGAVFVIVGIYVLIGRFFYKAWAKARTLYVVTDARVLSITGRRVREAPVSTQPVEWRPSRTHLSVTFGTSPGNRAVNLENTGWIGSGSGSAGGAVSFFDVADGPALRAAIDGARL